MERTSASLLDVEVLELLADEPELLAIADALVVSHVGLSRTRPSLVAGRGTERNAVFLCNPSVEASRTSGGHPALDRFRARR